MIEINPLLLVFILVISSYFIFVWIICFKFSIIDYKERIQKEILMLLKIRLEPDIDLEAIVKNNEFNSLCDDGFLALTQAKKLILTRKAFLFFSETKALSFGKERNLDFFFANNPQKNKKLFREVKSIYEDVSNYSLEKLIN